MDTSAQTQATQEQLIRAGLDQLSQEGRLTVDGVQERSGIKGRQTVQNNMELIREAVRQRNRILLDAAEANDFPIDAFHACARWALHHAQTQLADREAALDAEADQLRQARVDFKAEQEDLRLANKQAMQRAEEEERRRIKAEKTHEAAQDQWDRELRGVKSQLEAVRSKEAELEGQREADEAERDRLSTENQVLKAQVAELDAAQEEVVRLTKASEMARTEYSRLEDRLAEVKARLAESEQSHQKREAAWLTERDGLKDQILELKASAKVDEKRLADLSAEVSQLEVERDTLEAERNRHTETVHERAVEVATVTAQRDGLAEDREALSQELKRLSADNTKLNRTNSVLTSKLEALHAQLEKKT